MILFCPFCRIPLYAAAHAFDRGIHNVSRRAPACEPARRTTRTTRCGRRRRFRIARTSSGPLPRAKIIQTVVSDIFQISDLAHAVFGPVTRVQLFEPLTGEIMTGAAEGQGALQLHGACFNPASEGQSSVRPRPAALASSLFSLMRLAQPAVHPAGRDKFGGHPCHNVYPCF
jgi:hypothetical protein